MRCMHLTSSVVVRRERVVDMRDPLLIRKLRKNMKTVTADALETILVSDYEAQSNFCQM